MMDRCGDALSDDQPSTTSKTTVASSNSSPFSAYATAPPAPLVDRRPCPRDRLTDGRQLRTGDRVRVTDGRSFPEFGPGDIGTITLLNPDAGACMVNFDHRVGLGQVTVATHRLAAASAVCQGDAVTQDLKEFDADKASAKSQGQASAKSQGQQGLEERLGKLWQAHETSKKELEESLQALQGEVGRRGTQITFAINEALKGPLEAVDQRLRLQDERLQLSTDAAQLLRARLEELEHGDKRQPDALTKLIGQTGSLAERVDRLQEAVSGKADSSALKAHVEVFRGLNQETSAREDLRKMMERLCFDVERSEAAMDELNSNVEDLRQRLNEKLLQTSSSGPTSSGLAVEQAQWQGCVQELARMDQRLISVESESATREHVTEQLMAMVSRANKWAGEAVRISKQAYETMDDEVLSRKEDLRRLEVQFKSLLRPGLDGSGSFRQSLRTSHC